MTRFAGPRLCKRLLRGDGAPLSPWGPQTRYRQMPREQEPVSYALCHPMSLMILPQIGPVTPTAPVATATSNPR